MNLIILCPKNKGNTYELCKAVSNKIKCKLEVINEEKQISINDYDHVIIASGVYAGSVHKNIIRWIEQLDNVSINKLGPANILLTWIGRGSSDRQAYEGLKNILKDKGIVLQKSHITCYGKAFGFIKKDHPNDQDILDVLKWINKFKN